MSFVHPGYLWFLSLLAIPILIHLFYFRRHKKLFFPSLKYLKQQEQEKKSVRNIKRLLVLACRLLFLIALIIAFAQPYLNIKNVGKAGIPVVFIYVDNSYSMSAMGMDGTLISESKELAKRIVNSSSTKTRFLIYTNALSGVERKMLTKATAIQFIDQIKLNPTPRNLGAVLKFQEEYTQRYHREIEKISSLNRIVLSDFQKNSTVLSNYTPTISDFNDKLSLIQAVSQQTENRYIDSVWTESPVHKPGEQIQLFFRVQNFSDKKIENLNITLQFDGKKRMTNITIAPNSANTSYFMVTPSSTGYLEGKLSLSDAAITWDDEFYFTNKSASSGKIVIINGNNSEKSAEKVFETEPYYKVTAWNEASFNARELKNADLLVLNGLSSIASGLSEKIKRYVENGGSVFIMPGLDINLGEYNTLLKQLNLNGYSGAINQGNAVSEIAYKSMFFKGMFEKEKKDLNIPLIKSAYFLKNAAQSNAQVLIKLRNNLPLFVHQKSNGNVFLFNASTEESNGGFLRHALYPSMLLRAAELSLRALPLYYNLGQATTLSLEYEANTDVPVKLTSAQENHIPRQIQNGDILTLQLNSPELVERIKGGIYNVVGNTMLAKIAMNLNREESKLSYLDKEEIMARFNTAGLKKVAFQQLDRGVNSFEIELDKPSSFWEIFVILALLFLLLEMAILKFLLP
jgi:hypothetical protein